MSRSAELGRDTVVQADVDPVKDRVEVRVEADDARCADVLWSGARSLGLAPPPGETSGTAPPPKLRRTLPMQTRPASERRKSRRASEPAPSAEGGLDRPSAPRYLDVVGAAEYLGVTVGFVRRLVLERRVRYYKLGKYLRFEPDDLDTLVAVTRVDPVPSLQDPLAGRAKPVSRGSRPPG